MLVTFASHRLLLTAAVAVPVVAVAVADGIVSDLVAYHMGQTLAVAHCSHKYFWLVLWKIQLFEQSRDTAGLPACTMMALCIGWTLWNILTIWWLLRYWRVDDSGCANLLYHRCIFTCHRPIAHIFIVANGSILWRLHILLYYTTAQHLLNRTAKEHKILNN